MYVKFISNTTLTLFSNQIIMRVSLVYYGSRLNVDFSYMICFDVYNKQEKK